VHFGALNQRHVQRPLRTAAHAAGPLHVEGAQHLLPAGSHAGGQAARVLLLLLLLFLSGCCW
jgi:hypothetical protein